jgi:hypothetical protein
MNRGIEEPALEGGPFPVPLIEQSSMSLPLPRVSRAESIKSPGAGY